MPDGRGTRNRVALAACVLAAFAAPAAGQAIHKCVRAGQPAVYQTDPCPTDARTVRSLAYVPDPYAKPYRPDTRVRPYARATGAAAVMHTRNAPQQSQCEQARAQRDALLGRNNQGGTIDLRRVLNDAVHRACY